MQTIVLKHVQVFVVNYFEIFQIFFWMEGWVGGVNCIQTFFGFFFMFTRSLNRSSYLRSLSPGMSLVALLCIFSSISTCLS